MGAGDCANRHMCPPLGRRNSIQTHMFSGSAKTASCPTTHTVMAGLHGTQSHRDLIVYILFYGRRGHFQPSILQLPITLLEVMFLNCTKNKASKGTMVYYTHRFPRFAEQKGQYTCMGCQASEYVVQIFFPTCVWVMQYRPNMLALYTCGWDVQNLKPRQSSRDMQPQCGNSTAAGRGRARPPSSSGSCITSLERALTRCTRRGSWLVMETQSMATTQSMAQSFSDHFPSTGINFLVQEKQKTKMLSFGLFDSEQDTDLFS